MSLKTIITERIPLYFNYLKLYLSRLFTFWWVQFLKICVAVAVLSWGDVVIFLLVVMFQCLFLLVFNKDLPCFHFPYRQSNETLQKMLNNVEFLYRLRVVWLLGWKINTNFNRRSSIKCCVFWPKKLTFSELSHVYTSFQLMFREQMPCLHAYILHIQGIFIAEHL